MVDVLQFKKKVVYRLIGKIFFHAIHTLQSNLCYRYLLEHLLLNLSPKVDIRTSTVVYVSSLVNVMILKYSLFEKQLSSYWLFWNCFMAIIGMYRYIHTL